MLDQIIHFVGLCLFAGTWLLVGGWVVWASFRAVLRMMPARQVAFPASLPARFRARPAPLASLAA